MSMKLREAVSRLVRESEDGMLVEVSSKFEFDLTKSILADVKAAIAEHPRNCDVGTVKEQSERFGKFCRYPQKCNECKLYTTELLYECVLSWSQMPYEEEK